MMRSWPWRRRSAAPPCRARSHLAVPFSEMAFLGNVKALVRPSRWPGLVAGLPTFRRHWLLLRLRFFAWRAHATVEADLPPGVRVARRVAIEIGDWTHSSISTRPGTRLRDGVI